MAENPARRAVLFGCPVTGVAAPIQECPDKSFSQEMMGQGVVLFPTGGTVYAPADAKVDFSFFTKHAVGLETDGGVEFLIHVGIDTNRLDGQGFELFVKTGDRVKRGDRLLSFDLDVIRKAGYSSAMPFVICNSADLELEILKLGPVEAGEDLIRVR